MDPTQAALIIGFVAGIITMAVNGSLRIQISYGEYRPLGFLGKTVVGLLILAATHALFYSMLAG